jgi:C1A family cysteine protease
MRRNKGIVLVLNVALVLGIAISGFGVVTCFAETESWYEGITVNDPYETVTQSKDYVAMDDGDITPVISDEALVDVKSKNTLPSAYMYSLSKLTSKYPGVRNQGTYNTCWAFSAAGLAEFDLITDNKSVSSSINLSEAQIAYYTYHNLEDSFGGTAGDSLTPLTDYLRFGGSLYFASRTLLQWQGVVDESLMPYSSSSSTLKSYSAYTVDQAVAHLQNAYIINIHKNQDAVKQEIMNHGSVGIGLYMAGMDTYGDTAEYSKTGDKVATYYCPVSKDPDHALNIVGWDDDFPASSFAKKPSGNGAWFVRNSWSSSSKNSLYSYFWISYYDKGIEDDAWVLDFESADNYDYNYQYDGCGAIYGINGLLSNSSGNSLDITEFANVFKIQGSSNELLEAVGVAFNEASEVPYEISIYTNLSDTSNPKSGILSGTIKGSTTYAGTYTIPVDTEESIPKDSYFSVIVKISSGTSGVDAEYTYDYRKSSAALDLVAKATVKKNQSFIYYKDQWRDLSDLGTKVGNLCIKAYTKSASTSIAKTKSLKKSTVKTTSVKLIWGKTAGAKGYEIYRSSKKNGTYQKVATVKKCSYTNKNMKKNTTYYYKVRAYKTSGGKKIYGKFSSTIKVTTKK